MRPHVSSYSCWRGKEKKSHSYISKHTPPPRMGSILFFYLFLFVRRRHAYLLLLLAEVGV